MTKQEALLKARALLGDGAWVSFYRRGYKHGMAFRVGITQLGFGIGKGWGNSWQQAIKMVQKHRGAK